MNILEGELASIPFEFAAHIDMVMAIRSEAKDLLGDDWVQRQRRIVQQHANTYQRAAWGKVIFCFVLVFAWSGF